MIDRIIEFSAQQPVPRLPVRGGRVAGGLVVDADRIPLDAIPDLSDTQVIVYSRWDRSPDILEDQVTYPIVTAMLGAPKVKDVRGFSDFGYSYVYIIFEEGTDIYWARSRTLEYLSKILPRLPQDVQTELGPDATGVGWVFQYALVDRPGSTTWPSCARVQDWFLRYHLQVGARRGGSRAARRLRAAVPGERGSQPAARLTACRFRRWWRRCARGNNDVGGRLVEFTGREYMVRGRGYARSTADLESIVAGRQRIGRADPGARRGQRDARSGHAARRRRSGRQGRSGLRHRRDAAGRERAARDRAREGEAEGDRAGPARRA